MLHKGFQIDGMKYLSDIYISQNDMYDYRDKRKNDLKEFERQIDAFEKKTAGKHDSMMSSIRIGAAELADTHSVKAKFQDLNDQAILTWSIVSEMSEVMKRFHTNLKVMESMNSTDDEKYEAKLYLTDYDSHENRIENQKQLKPQMDEHHNEIDEFIDECKSIQIRNAEKIVELVSSLSHKQKDSMVSQIQKLQSNNAKVVEKFNYLLKPAELPSLHEKLKQEFARRYHFEALIEFKEKEFNKLISMENIRRSNFLSEHKLKLSDNSLTRCLLDYSIKFSIDRNRNMPKITDITTEETKLLQSEYRKDARHREKLQALNDDVKKLKNDLKLKNEEFLRIKSQNASEIERINRELSSNMSYYKDLVEEVVQEKRKEIDHLASVVKAPIVLEHFSGDLRNSEDVINSLRSTISNKTNDINRLENKIIGLNRVISSLTVSNFNMMSTRISEVKGKVDHFESLYKQEKLDKQAIEDSYSKLEVDKLRTERELKDSLGSYTKALNELHFVKSEHKKLTQSSVDRSKLKEYEVKMKKFKEIAESSESSVKDIMNQNSGLRSTIEKLRQANESLAKEKDETLKNCLQMVNEKYEQTQGKDTENILNYETENSTLKKEVEDLQSLVTELQIEVSEANKEKSEFQTKLESAWKLEDKNSSVEIESLRREIHTLKQQKLQMSAINDSNTFIRNEGVSIGLLEEGQKRIFIKDQSSRACRYIPLILEYPDSEESQSEVKKTKLVKRKMQRKIFLNTESLKSNIKTILEKSDMIVVAEISDIEQIDLAEDSDEYDMTEGESYISCSIKAIEHLGYFMNEEFCQITFYHPGQMSVTSN